ncbi:MAG UNVERIFIED_CONTAM: FHA domain-containing protein [Anaerolineae bacterium]
MQGFDGFRLVMRRGPQPNQAYELNKDVITIGRDITNDIVINDPEVSRHHLRFTRTEDGYTLEDFRKYQRHIHQWSAHEWLSPDEQRRHDRLGRNGDARLRAQSLCQRDGHRGRDGKPVPHNNPP